MLSLKQQLNMTCWNKRTKYVAKKGGEKEDVVKKKNKVFPEEKVTVEFMNRFEREIIQCGGCNGKFPLGSNELKIHCNICNQFFHCKIAGECLGKECRSYEHVPRYCYGCVGKIIGRGTCICKECFKS